MNEFRGWARAGSGVGDGDNVKTSLILQIKWQRGADAPKLPSVVYDSKHGSFFIIRNRVTATHPLSSPIVDIY